MTSRPPPQPTADRAHRTIELMSRGETDIARWSEPENLSAQWDARAAMAADWIPAGAAVLDVGCGAMSLARYLRTGCRYFPADVVRRSPDCLLTDLNRHEFPAGHYDWVTFLGVLEYVHDIHWPLTRAKAAAPNLLVTYCTNIHDNIALRRGMGWVNDLMQSEFEAAIAAAGWQIQNCRDVKRGATNVQLMFVCTQAT